MTPSLRGMGQLAALGKGLLALRKAKGLSQEALATKADIGGGAQVSRYERDEERPSIENLDKLLDGLGLTLHDLARALDEVNGRTPTQALGAPPAGAFEQRAAEPLNLASLDVAALGGSGERAKA